MRPDTAFHRPHSLPEAIAMIDRLPDAQLLAGGQSLVPELRRGDRQPTHLVSIDQLPELSGLSKRGDAIFIGATATHDAIATSPLIKDAFPALAKLVGSIGDLQVRNRGTLGGAIAAAAYRSDYSAAFLALGARVHIPGTELPYDAYLAQCGFDGAPPNMFVLGVSLPIADHTAAYEKISHPAAGYAECGVFASWSGSEARIAVISDTAPPFRWTALEAELRADDALAAVDSTPVHPLTDYAAELARALTRRALKTIA